MIIRPSTNSDIPNIINLLKISLGESLMPKSEDYWTWKHVKNPFGESPVWVAEEDKKMIGVRAFMRWNWRINNKQIRAIRAVDTATHPDYQGKGIFKSLTLGLLKQCNNEGIDLVYNTPNEKSKPGYLKMGWVEAGQLPVNISIKNPLNVIKSKFQKNKTTKFLQIVDKQDFGVKRAIDNYVFNFNSKKFWHTSYSKEYLNWRYAQIPIIPYYAHYNSRACIFFRLKTSGLGVEVRICDTFGDLVEISQLIKEVFKTCKFDYMSIDGFSPLNLPGIFRLKQGFGPDVTLRALTKNNINDFSNFSNWHPTLGDLEVF